MIPRVFLYFSWELVLCSKDFKQWGKWSSSKLRSNQFHKSDGGFISWDYNAYLERKRIKNNNIFLILLPPRFYDMSNFSQEKRYIPPLRIHSPLTALYTSECMCISICNRGEQVKKMMSLWNRVDKWVGKTEMKHIRVKVVVFYVHLHFLRVRAAVAATRESLPETFAVSQFRGR